MQAKDLILITVLFSLLSVRLAVGQDPQWLAAREWIVNQPQDFSNEVLFERRGGTTVRSSRYAASGAPFGDFDGDFDIDQHDYHAMQICLSFSGPGFTVPPACLAFDRDGDDDVDLLDMAEFQSAFTGTVVGVFVEAGELVPVVAPPDGYYSGAPGAWGNNALNGIARHGGYSQDDFWYQWTLIGKPEGSGQVIISNSAFPSTSYTIASPLLIGEYVFQLKVTNLVTIEFGLDTTVLALHECFSNADCSDGIACTQDICTSPTGPCGNLPSNMLCPDPLFCDGVDTCDPTHPNAGADGCISGLSNFEFLGGYRCGMSACDEDSDSCFACTSNLECSDGIACTTDTCNGATGVCSHTDNCTGLLKCNVHNGLCE